MACSFLLRTLTCALLILLAGFAQGQIDGLVLHDYAWCPDRGIRERCADLNTVR